MIMDNRIDVIIQLLPLSVIRNANSGARTFTKLSNREPQSIGVKNDSRYRSSQWQDAARAFC